MRALSRAAAGLAVALAGLVALPAPTGCGGRSDRAPARGDAGPGAALALPDRPVADAAPRIEIDAAPIARTDVLEGAEAAAAMAAGRGDDAGAPPASDDGATLRDDGVGPFRLDQPRAEVLPLLGAGARFARLPPAPHQPERELIVLREGSLAWLELELCGGRVCRLTVSARTARALTDEGIGVGSSFDEVVLAHGEARAVLRAGALAGWVVVDRPGLLFELTPPGTLLPADDAPDDAPDGGVADGARVRRITVLGPEALSAPD